MRPRSDTVLPPAPFSEHSTSSGWETSQRGWPQPFLCPISNSAGPYRRLARHQINHVGCDTGRVSHPKTSRQRIPDLDHQRALRPKRTPSKPSNLFLSPTFTPRKGNNPRPCEKLLKHPGTLRKSMFPFHEHASSSTLSAHQMAHVGVAANSSSLDDFWVHVDAVALWPVGAARLG